MLYHFEKNKIKGQSFKHKHSVGKMQRYERQMESIRVAT